MSGHSGITLPSTTDGLCGQEIRVLKSKTRMKPSRQMRVISVRSAATRVLLSRADSLTPIEFRTDRPMTSTIATAAPTLGESVSGAQK